MKREILIVDDDRALLTSLSLVLEEAGYGVRTAMNGDLAVAAVREKRPDLVLLDVAMPGKCGLDVCRELREGDSSLPIVFLTAYSSPKDELRGLAVGGDLYVSKTVDDDVLLARIAALLRIRDGKDDKLAGDFDFAEWRIEASKFQMRRGEGRAVPLIEREIAFLRLLALHKGEILGRDFLMAQLWAGDTDVTDNRLSVMCYLLRKKLGRSGSALACVRGVGYSYRP